MPESAPNFTWMASTSALLRPASSSDMSRILIAIDSSCTDHTSSALPPNLEDFAVFQKHRHGALAGSFPHANQCRGIGVHIEFDKVAAREFQPLPQLLRVWATRRSKQLKHRQFPPVPRGASDRWWPAPPECAECSHSERLRENPRACGVQFHRHRTP